MDQGRSFFGDIHGGRGEELRSARAAGGAGGPKASRGTAGWAAADWATAGRAAAGWTAAARGGAGGAGANRADHPRGLAEVGRSLQAREGLLQRRQAQGSVWLLPRRLGPEEELRPRGEPREHRVLARIEEGRHRALRLL